VTQLTRSPPNPVRLSLRGVPEGVRARGCTLSETLASVSEIEKLLGRIAGALEKIAGMNETELERAAELESLSDAELDRPAKSNEDIRWSDDP
jgi:hypothetical protein